MARTLTAALTALALAGCMSPGTAQPGTGMLRAAAPAPTVYYGNYAYPMAFCRRMVNGTVYCW
jgi:hypothetical protein